MRFRRYIMEPQFRLTLPNMIVIDPFKSFNAFAASVDLDCVSANHFSLIRYFQQSTERSLVTKQCFVIFRK